jgi:hypothetical protein
LKKKRTETPNTDVLEVLTKGRDFVRYDEWTHRGLCNVYRMIKVLSANLLEVFEYHHCQFAYEDIEDEDLEEFGPAWRLTAPIGLWQSTRLRTSTKSINACVNV